MVYDDDNGDVRAKASWNFAAEQSRHIHNLITKAMNFMLNGNTGSCYWTLTGIRILINPYLDKGERKYFKKAELVINKYIGRWDVWKKSVEEGQPRKDLIDTKHKFSRLNKIYFLKIMDLLRDLGYLPDKEDRTSLGF